LGRFTLLENGLHYRDPATGAWLPSRDLIESFPDGAVARYGPLRALFSHDVNAESVFDLETPAGARLRGGVRALEWLDEVTGERQLLGVVRASAPLELVPPHRLVARDAFEGVLADVVLEWRHNRFSQSVVLRELPLPPAGFEARATRLVVVTEFVEAPEPEVQRVAGAGEGLAPAEDHVGLHFDGASILVGHAFAAEGIEPALQVGAGGATGEAVSVRKTWTALSGGGAVLEESVGWETLAALGTGLPRQAGASGADERTWRTARAEWANARRPVEVAQAPYRPAGLVVDFELSGSAYSYTFAMGETYSVPLGFAVGPGTATFQPGCTIKYANNAWLRITGPISFADTLQTPVFTSKDDDSFGETLPGSTGVPSKHANPALEVYYNTYSTTVRKARFRWAKIGVRYNTTCGYARHHYINDSLFEHCDIGVQIANCVTFHGSGLEKNDVTTPFYVIPYGECSPCTMTQAPFYMDKSFAGLNGDDGTIPPDTMGAIGPNHFLTVTTRGQIAVFDRTTGRPVEGQKQLLREFFNTTSAADPRIWYDHGSQRWAVSAMHSEDPGTGDKVFLKVSQTNNPLLGSNNWLLYPVPVAVPSEQWVDFPTLGMDVNGIYISVQIRESTTNRHGFWIQAFKKPDVYNNPSYQPPSPQILTLQELDTWCIQPAYNFDAPPIGGYAWFVAKGPSSGNLGGQIYCRRLRWNDTNPEWVGDWQAVTGSYREYFDIQQGDVLAAPQTVPLGNTGSRLLTAVIRNGYLWSCQHVGLDGGGNDRYDGNPVDRSAVQWFKLQVGTSGLTYSAHGRIYDTASNNPYWYHFPSLNANAAGDLLIGFSGSRNGEYIGAFLWGRKANGVGTARPNLAQAGRGSFSSNGWGDYSATSIDPTDGSFWTIQAYADPKPISNLWGTWITQVRVYP